MQTLKTGAIIVLLMTVVFSAYTSLTSPPQRLSNEVVDALDLDLDSSGDFLAIDDGLPPSLADIGMSDDEFASSDSGMSVAGVMPGSSEPSINGSSEPSASGSAPQGFASTPAIASLGSPVSDGSASGGFSMALSDQSAGTGQSPGSTAPFGASAGNGTSAIPVSAGRNSMGGFSSPANGLPQGVPEQYPVTNQQFQMPDPEGFRNDGSNVSAAWNPDQSAEPLSTSPVAQVSALGDNLSLGDVPAVSRETQLRGLVNAIKTADRQYGEDRLKDALATLSLFYGTPDLTSQQRGELLGRLDALAAEVIYSRRHLLESPHRVQQNETLMQIADQYQIPWQLLANINGVRDPVAIQPGTDLKVVQGPFRAEVDTRLGELTLFLGDMYAGRFEIGLGQSPAPTPGTYTVQEKQTARTFYDQSGAAIPAGSADNPYGNAWIDLGGQVCIHGSPDNQSPSSRGCISLAADSADDLYAILSQGSSVVVK